MEPGRPMDRILDASRGAWRSDAERDKFKREIDQARAVYMKLSAY